MNISLLGKKALIGGSSKGIGKAIATQLAESGASVTLMARNEVALKEIVRGLPVSHGQKHRYLVVDFLDFEMFKSTIDAYFKDHSIDILINNTQGPKGGGVLDLDIEDYQTAFDLLFKCVVYTTQKALPQMKWNTWGRIINVASISVKEPLSYLALSKLGQGSGSDLGKNLGDRPRET